MLSYIMLIYNAVTLNVCYSNFQLVTRSLTNRTGFNHVDELLTTVKQLMTDKTEVGKRYVRLIGVALSKWIEQ